MTRKVYMNGSFVDEQDAKVSIYDSSLMFGDMVFEMTRSFNGEQFKLREHIKRLLTGIKIFRIPLEETEDSIYEKCLLTIDQNKGEFKDDDEHRLMIDVSRGLLDIYKGVDGLHKEANLIIADFPFTLETDGNYVVTAAGILGNSSAPFGLIASGLEVMAVDSNHFGLKVFHGATDAPSVDIYANGGLLVENLSYSEYAGYLQVPVGDYTIDITAHGSEQSVASFAAPLASSGGGAGIVFASGFLAPPATTDSAFTLILTERYDHVRG